MLTSCSTYFSLEPQGNSGLNKLFSVPAGLWLLLISRIVRVEIQGKC